MRWRGMVIGFGSLSLIAAAPPPISDLKPVALHPGVNVVPGFLVDGRAATIVQGWRGNGNAHGYHVWMVLGGPSEDNGPGVIGVEGRGDTSVDPTISDAPFDGERIIGSVRFVTARIAGKPVSLLIEATLDPSPSGVSADHATARVRWFRLSHDAGAVGRTTDEFVPIGMVQTSKRYCTAELAMRDVAQVPLPSDFAGANRVDGCFVGG